MIVKIKEFYSQHKYKILAATSFITAGYFYSQYSTDKYEVKLSTLIEALKQKKVHEVILEGKTAYFRSEGSEWFRTYLGKFSAEELLNILKNSGNVIFSSREESNYGELLNIIAIFGLGILSFKIMMREMNKPPISAIDISPLSYHNAEKFDDFFGGEMIKEKFREVIDYLKNPQRYQKMGARIRRGILFYGPPGTGKTLLARALANEAEVSFIKIVASEFQQMFVGVGAKRVRQLFKSARQCKNGCIIFVDEIDALGSRVNHLRDSHETTTTINQFLSEFDGFQPNEKIIIVGATNRLDLVDSAILRSGRFDLKVRIELPCQEERRGILLKILDRKIPNNSIDQDTLNKIAQETTGWSGADMETLVNEAIYKAIRAEKEELHPEELLAAYHELKNHR